MPTHPFRSIPRWKFPKWQPQFQDAILEFDPRKLPSLVEAAATAIFVRYNLRKRTEKSSEPLPMRCALFVPSRPKDWTAGAAGLLPDHPL